MFWLFLLLSSEPAQADYACTGPVKVLVFKEADVEIGCDEVGFRVLTVKVSNNSTCPVYVTDPGFALLPEGGGDADAEQWVDGAGVHLLWYSTGAEAAPPVAPVGSDVDFDLSMRLDSGASRTLSVTVDILGNRDTCDGGGYHFSPAIRPESLGAAYNTGAAAPVQYPHGFSVDGVFTIDAAI